MSAATIESESSEAPETLGTAIARSAIHFSLDPLGRLANLLAGHGLFMLSRRKR